VGDKAFIRLIRKWLKAGVPSSDSSGFAMSSLRSSELLGQHPPRQEDGETAHVQEEVPGLSGEPEGVAAQQSQSPPEGAGGDTAAEVSRSLQLLRGDRELRPLVALLEREPPDHLPWPQPAQPTQKLQLGHV